MSCYSQMVMDLLCRFALTSITDKLFTGLDNEQHWLCRLRNRSCLPFARSWTHPRFLVESVLLIYYVFVLCFCFVCLSSTSCALSLFPVPFTLTFIYYTFVVNQTTRAFLMMSVSGKFLFSKIWFFLLLRTMRTFAILIYEPKLN